MSDFEIDELPIPAELDDSPAARDFVASVAVSNAVDRLALGNDDRSQEPAELLTSWLDAERRPKRLFVARVDGRIVARADIEWRTDGEVADTSWQELHVLPEFQSRGIGYALADRLEEVARTEGKSRMVARVYSPDGPGQRVVAVTGFGSLPRENREVRFLLARGFVLRQVIRKMRASLPIDTGMLAEHLHRAEAKAGDGYRIHHWGDYTPPEWREDMVRLVARFWADTPLAGVPFPDANDPNSPWTTSDVQKSLASPTRRIVAAVEHVPSGRLVGCTGLAVPSNPLRAVVQWATFVAAEHRGRALGILMKIANVQELQRQYPGHPAMVAANAEENRAIIEINQAFGFETHAYQGAWRKALE